MNHPFTPEYIRMAKDAKEIQRTLIQAGEYYGEWAMSDAWLAPKICVMNYWIPRLDQLFAMFGCDEGGWPPGPIGFMAACGFQETPKDPDPNRVGKIDHRFASFIDWHELALAVIMRTNYGKIWNGTEWEKNHE